MSESKINSNEENQNLSKIELQLGDIIQITNPVNENLNNQIFIIDYIDKFKMYLINTDTLERIKLSISNEGILGDGNITTIGLLSRADTPSFARQNGLIPGKWINIYFDGDYPVIITGEITNLEQDMIEIKTIDNDTLYINFAYKGIPEDLPISNIEIRNKPKKNQEYENELTVENDENVENELNNENVENDENELNVENDENEKLEIPELEKEKTFIDREKLQISVPIKDIKEQIREIIVKADQVEFGNEDLGPITRFVDVSTKSQRFSIETQVADLLDDLLSTIPNTQRTPRVLNNIHIMIERFKQLREKFSSFDQYGNINSIIVKEANYKPLSIWLKNFNINLYWILPVVKNIKKVYNIIDIDEENNDVINLDLDDELIKMNEIIQNYKSNNLSTESNKYTILYSEISNFFIPFNYINDENQEGIIIEKEVNTNINTIVDNLEDMYSSVFSNNVIRNRRFVINRYNLGDNKLDILDNTSSKMTTIRVPITKNDMLSLKSIMILPEPTIRFSKINLPGTDILTKANLNEIFLNYWDLLKKKTNVSNIFIDSFENELNLDENNYVNGIKNYVLNINEENLKNITRNELYSKYTELIIPKIRVIFNLMKKYINGKLSIIEIISYLEPFLIYTDDLTYKQYTEIIKFIDEKISNYNKNIIELSRIFKIILTIKSNNIITTKAFSLIEIINKQLKDEVLETGYQLLLPKISQTYNENYYSNSEYLRKIILKDYAKLYTISLIYQNISLIIPNDVIEIFKIEEKKNNDKLKDLKEQDNCKNIIISKLYTSLEDLENDNDKIIYFDKKYDKTNYGLMEEDNKKGGYAEQVINLNPEKLKEFIVIDQIKKNNLPENEALYLAETLIEGNKKVIDGQYAILYKGYSENIVDESDYYIRKDNKWVLDEEMSNTNFKTDESTILCNLEKKCISVTTQANEKCENIEVNELGLQNSLLKNIINEFDEKYKFSKEEFQKNIKEKFEYFLSIMPLISKIETNNLLKYNNEKYKLGLNLDEKNEIIISPFLPLLDIILSQKDFVKKQNDIIRFVDKFARNNVVNETPFWYYCIKTDVKLIPSFKYELAIAFSKSSYFYQLKLEEIKSKQGQLSDDGNWWTDKYTGWPICPGDFDIEEGYDDGFKVSSRAVMEEEAGNKIIASTNERKIKYITPENIMINNIINTLSIAMGINMEIQKEFIINNVVESIRNTVENESLYKDRIKLAAQKGKKIDTYKDYFNASLLYYTLGMYLIAIQTSIPSIKTRKTHPGCVRSFTGYPFEGQGDLSSLTYLSCIVFDVRESGEPWNVLKRNNVDKIQNKIKAGIDGHLIQLPDIQRKFIEKTEYLLTNSITDIPEEHDISLWTDFLPPIIPFKITHLLNISEEFKKGLINDLRSGSETQREKILVIESKIIKFSLAIQEKIMEIVKKHKALLYTSNNEPYLENSCCDSIKNEPTIDYFININKNISDFNDIVFSLSNILDDIKAKTLSSLLCSKINTKNIYPQISTKFDEKTIYLAFIFYCKFKSLLPIPEDLLSICINKPDTNFINQSDSIERIIEKLKDDGRNYTDEQFIRLLELVSRENIINIQSDNLIISNVAKLTFLLEAINDEKNENYIIDPTLNKLLFNAIDTFNIASEENTPDVKKLNNFLFDENQNLTIEIKEFVENNCGTNVSKNLIKKFKNTIDNLDIWVTDEYKRNEDIKISNENMFNIVNFFKTFINNFANVFPNIILNKVNYEDTLIPKYYNFSKNHSNKLKKYISEYFEKLKQFYGISTLINILKNIQTYSINLVNLAQTTPCFSNIKTNNIILKGVIDEYTSRLIFKYYLLSILMKYITLTDDDNMIVTEITQENNTIDLFSVEYVDELETRIDYQTNINTKVLSSNKFLLKQKTAELLISFIEILRTEKEIINISYEDIQDRVFKLREKEKDMVTDRLKAMTDEQRDVDTILKISKQGPIYSKALEKGLTVFDQSFYDKEQEMRDELEMAERKIRNKNKNINDENIDILIDDYLEEQSVNREINMDAFDISNLNEDYYNGNFDGVDAPEEEYDDYDDYN